MRRLRPRLLGLFGHVEFLGGFVGEEERLRGEVFFLAYHLHWSHDDILALPTEERWFYTRRLSEQLQEERAAIENSRKS
ncbi:DUF6760 family protein [Streptomyces sp. NPDC048172]|uniref:DUF6760 family protein n=1 Tax=Streptomyces sp. NPDC048172 TaxID=3365505 RepID=UPI003717356A